MHTPLTYRSFFSALFAGAAFSMTPVLAQPQANPAPVAERIADRVTRFFQSPAAREAALPSYALLAEPNAKAMSSAAAAGKDYSIAPVFSQADAKLSVSIDIPPGTSLYATGEVTGPLLRNGRKAVAWNTDAYGYGVEALSLYKSHPWVLAVRPDGTSFGVLADTTYRCEIDTGYTNPAQIRFTADGPSFPVVVIERDEPEAVVRELSRLTGRMPLPPKWALGYNQCRYSYYPDARVREIAKGFRDHKIPCDVIWFDIDYMEAFRIFTFDRGHFPDPRTLNADLLAQGFHNVWMIDPGMKSRAERGPADRPQGELDAEPAAALEARKAEIARYGKILADADARDVWVKRADGKPYEGEVWPGWCKFPDFTRPDVRQWWGGLYRDFVAQGVTGVWNDMNEPAVFNVKSKTMPEDNIHAGDPTMIAPSGKPQGDRARGPHARYHNVYGLEMVRATQAGILAAFEGQKRAFVLSRALFIGGQRYAAGWSGDNSADWYHLEASIPMVLNMGLSGFPLYGPDIGGFAGNGDADLFARWMGIGAMLPFARGHTGKGNIHKEPWSFGPAVEATCREALARRYRLMPYLYSVAREASETGLPIARPVFFADPRDPALRSEDDAFLIGRDLLVVAHVTPDRARVVAMPKGHWREIEHSDNPDLPRLFVRPGAIIPVGPDQQFIGERPMDELKLLVNLDEHANAAGTLYDDDGETYAYSSRDFRLTTFTAELVGGELKVREAADGNRAASWKSITPVLLK